MKVTAVIPSAGSGKRMNACLPSTAGKPVGKAKKQFLDIAGKALLLTTATVFDECQAIDEIIVVAAKDDIEITKKILKGIKKLSFVVVGGTERQDSVFSGIKAVKIESDEDIIVVHDAARPLITKELISKAVTEVKTNKAVVVGVPSKDTVKMISDDGTVLDTLDRDKVWLVQTPQVFLRSLIQEAYERADRVGYKATDDSRLVERLGIKVKMIMGSYDNIKVTTKEDMHTAEMILNERKNK